VIFIFITLVIILHFSWILLPQLHTAIYPQQTQQNKTALILVVENNDFVGVNQLDDLTLKRVAQLLHPFQYKKIKSMSSAQLIDKYFEDLLAKKILAYSKQYDKTIYLTDQQASYENFKKQIKILTASNYKIDLLLHLHGGQESIWFYHQKVSANQLVDDLKPMRPDINYVYQTLCHGSSLLKFWDKLGAKNANGASNNNYYVVFGPIKYSQLRNKGLNFYQSSNQSYIFEKKLYQKISSFVPALKFMTAEQTKTSSQFKYLDNN
jgi:superfamily II DNA or RNA helicase